MAILPVLFLLSAAPDRVDLLIRGGTIYAGDAEPFVGDVAVRGDRIVQVGGRSPSATRVIDARGMVVAPGFIDPHTHVEAMLVSGDARERLVLPFLMQGVTTAFVGNDGGGDPALPSMSARPTAINHAAYVGFGAVRRQVMGEGRRAPTDAELRSMKALVAGAMCRGAMGLSTGLYYAPQSFAATPEVVELAREAGARGGVYDSHIRDEASYTIGLAAAVDEAIAIGREARMPVNISHIKALGVDVQGQADAVIGQVEAAQRAGQKVTADQYPWSASGTTLVSSLVPVWAQDGGRAALLKRLDDRAVLPRLVADMKENLRMRGGPDKLLITEGTWKGRTLAQVTGSGDPILAAATIILVADPAVASFNQDERDIAAFMARPWVMSGSDASTGHPRVYGSFARKYAEYVVRRRVLTLRAFVERSSTLAADTFGLKDRGRIKAGAIADIVVFDPKQYAAQATYDRPTRLASGVRTVIVAGKVAVANGRATGIAAGRPLPRTPTPGTCP
jgi:N-acyl-D-aspartate/D-glutamate deacylase